MIFRSKYHQTISVKTSKKYQDNACKDYPFLFIIISNH
jgi:hypothetical protein